MRPILAGALVRPRLGAGRLVAPSSPLALAPAPLPPALRRPFSQINQITSSNALVKSLPGQAQRRLASSSSDAPQETLTTLLNQQQQQLLRVEFASLGKLVAALEHLGALPEDVAALKTSMAQLEDLFLLVVVGEFNSGKSSFLNALLGKRYLEEGVTPTTASIDILRYGDKFTVNDSAVGLENQRVVRVPVNWLREISLVDTPGTNAVFRAHQTITEHFLPRADLVLWLTSADRPFSESERKFLENVEAFRKKVIVILNKIDLLEEEKDRVTVYDFVKNQFKTFLGVEPQIFPVSAKRALSAKTSPEALSNPLWASSQFAPLEQYILHTLSSDERAWLKLKNPIGLSQHLLAKYSAETNKRTAVLREDVAALDRIQADLDEYRKDMLQDVALHMERVDNVLLRLNERASEFLSEKIAITNILELLKDEKFKRAFQDEVVADTGLELERAVQEMVDWILKRNAKQWNTIFETLQIRAQLNSAKMVGTVKTQFEYNRDSLITDLGSTAEKVISLFDRKREAQALNDTVKSSIYQTAIIEVGALGLGGLISASAFDVTGILPASAVAVTGLAILPYTRQKLKRGFRHKLDDLRQKMSESLQTQFTKHLDDGIVKINENIRPYSHFVRTEQGNVDKMMKELQTIDKDLRSLADSIDRSFGK